MSATADQSYERGQHAPDHGAHGEHQGGVRLYVMVAIALVVLTSFSYATHLPLWSSVFGDSLAIKRVWMMAVSCTKAMLVILFFMHLKWEANWKWVLTVPASLMSVLLVLALIPDVALRYMDTWHSGPSRQRLIYAADRPESASHQEQHSGGQGAAQSVH
jgi:cytochrome c oxidase subunit 4